MAPRWRWVEAQLTPCSARAVLRLSCTWQCLRLRHSHTLPPALPGCTCGRGVAAALGRAAKRASGAPGRRKAGRGGWHCRRRGCDAEQPRCARWHIQIWPRSGCVVPRRFHHARWLDCQCRSDTPAPRLLVVTAETFECVEVLQSTAKDRVLLGRFAWQPEGARLREPQVLSPLVCQMMPSFEFRAGARSITTSMLCADTCRHARQASRRW